MSVNSIQIVRENTVDGSIFISSSFGAVRAIGGLYSGPRVTNVREITQT